MTSNTLLTYNLETSNPEKSNKQVKLISFEKILSTSSLKQNGTPPVESKQQQQKDHIKFESDVLNFMNFDIENNVKTEKLKEKIKKIKETRKVLGKNATVLMNTEEEDRLSVKSSQYSERMSEKMVENIQKNHGETEKLIENFKKFQGDDKESSKISDGGVEIKNLGSPLKNIGGFLETPVKTPEIIYDETKINNKIVDEKVDQIRSNPVISLVKFIRKDDSKRYIFLRKSTIF